MSLHCACIVVVRVAQNVGSNLLNGLHRVQGRGRLLDHSCRHDHQRSRVESGARRRYQEGLKYADKECWNDLDRITCQHPYNFNAIEQWPLDAAVICKPTDRASVLLGSIKAACSLEDIFKTLSVKVTVVVTMCADEMEIRGAPKDWARYFQQGKVFHIKCQLEDTTLTPPHRWDERIPDLVASCWNSGKLSVANSGNNPCWQ